MEMEALQFAVWSGLILVGGGGLLFWLTSPDGDDTTPRRSRVVGDVSSLSPIAGR
ncbi:MAG: hypothetical protein HC828_02050 [Blastochloris sp.]|nr:hypothetical protein [Blastochloris sp.]